MAWQGFNIFSDANARTQPASRVPTDTAIASGHRRDFISRAAFILIVLIPTSLAAAYYFLLASPRYVSEAQFIVRGVSSSRVSGLDAFFRVFGISRTVDDTNVVDSYILSRDAVKALEARAPLREIFSRPEGDNFARFPRFWEKDDFESLYRYYLQRVNVVIDSSKGISTLDVVTFRPKDSADIARQLLLLAEDVANRMNVRAQRDTIAAAQKDVDDAEGKVIAAQAALTSFRNRSLVIDPSKSSDSELTTLETLWSDLTETLAEIREHSITSPNSPADAVLLARVEALRERIAAERDKVRGGGEALGAKVSDFEGLSLARDLADKSLAAALDSLELARQEARRQQVYIDEVAEPNTPDESTEPQRLRTVATVFVLTFSVFSVLWILSVGAQEHKQ
jgi:capsular polysaccharide transport system permease protein